MTPTMYYPVPTEQQRVNGIMKRYFAQKINEPGILEISSNAFTSENDVNKRGIDDELYITIELEWTIKGPIEEVRKTNRRVISQKESEMPGLGNLLSDLTEFHE